MYRKNPINTEEIQINLFDLSVTSNPKKFKKLEDSWAGYFRNEILPAIDEDRFKDLYSDDTASRPNVPVNQIAGGLILKELFGLSDEELVDQIEFNEKFRYALDIHTGSCPYSPRTLTRFRTKIYYHDLATGGDLIHDLVTEDIFKPLQELMQVDTQFERMDSMMIEANIKNLTRNQLLYETIRLCVKELEKADCDLPKELRHYSKANDFNTIFYYDKKSSAHKKTQRLIKEAQLAIKIAKKMIPHNHAYLTLVRVFDEQTCSKDGEICLKEGKEDGLNSQTVQSPHDTDATYREKKGDHCGYAANIVEVGKKGETMYKDYDYAPNITSDILFFYNYLSRQEEAYSDSSEKTTRDLVADGAYWSKEAGECAREYGINLITTALSGKQTDPFLADFLFNEEGTKILSCPNGKEPIRTSYQESSGAVRANFKKSDCTHCPFREKCQPKEQKRSFVKTVSITAKIRAGSAKQIASKDFSKYKDYRNGVETVPADLRRNYDVDHIPVRGLLRSRQFFGFKIAASAIRKYERFRKRQKAL